MLEPTAFLDAFVKEGSIGDERLACAEMHDRHLGLLPTMLFSQTLLCVELWDKQSCYPECTLAQLMPGINNYLSCLSTENTETIKGQGLELLVLFHHRLNASQFS